MATATEHVTETLRRVAQDARSRADDAAETVADLEERLGQARQFAREAAERADALEAAVRELGGLDQPDAGPTPGDQP